MMQKSFWKGPDKKSREAGGGHTRTKEKRVLFLAAAFSGKPKFKDCMFLEVQGASKRWSQIEITLSLQPQAVRE